MFLSFEADSLVGTWSRFLLFPLIHIELRDYMNNVIAICTQRDVSRFLYSILRLVCLVFPLPQLL